MAAGLKVVRALRLGRLSVDLVLYELGERPRLVWALSCSVDAADGD